MHDTPTEFSRGEYLITTDRRRIDLDLALGLLHETEWATDMPRDVLARAIENSVTFGLFVHEELIGLGRAVTDLATYAYWTDVVITARYQRQGLGAWLVSCMLQHPELQGLRRVALLTHYSRTLYARAGFSPDAGVSTYMEMRPGPKA